MQSTGKPCHNCRRRRLRCDRSWPSCHKCAVSGQECLGYGKVFVWTQAIDENGNLKSPSSARKGAVASVSGSNPPSTPSTPNLPSAKASISAFQPPASSTSTSATASPVQHRAEGPTSGSVPTSAFHSPQFQHTLPSRPSRPASPGELESAAGAGLEPFPEVSSPGTSSTGALTDPLFQDLDRNSRYYLAYCKFPLLSAKSSSFPRGLSHHYCQLGCASLSSPHAVLRVRTLRTCMHRMYRNKRLPRSPNSRHRLEPFTACIHVTHPIAVRPHSNRCANAVLADTYLSCRSCLPGSCRS